MTSTFLANNTFKKTKEGNPLCPVLIIFFYSYGSYGGSGFPEPYETDVCSGAT